MHLEANQYNLAEADYDEALRLNPALPSPYLNLASEYLIRGHMHFEEGRPTKAEG